MSTAAHNIRLAKSIASRDNGIEIRNGSVLFGNRKRDPKNKDKCEKGALQCALEYAEKMEHTVVVKFELGKKDHWYGSYLLPVDAIAAFSVPDSHYYEILRAQQPRKFYADVEFVYDTILKGDADIILTVEQIFDRVGDVVCDLADELSGQRVPRTIQVATSKGDAVSRAWKGVAKVSAHIVFDFGFPDQRSTRAFADAVVNRINQDAIPYLRYTKDGRIETVVDKVPYMVNQSWRCLGSIKAEDTDARRRLMPLPGSSKDICDHLVGIYGQSTVPMLQIDLSTASLPPHVKRALFARPPPAHDDITRMRLQIPAKFIRLALEGLSSERAEDYHNWTRVVWCAFNVCFDNDCLDLGRELIHAFSKRSGKYDESSVNALWNSTGYREAGLHWPAMRSWVWEDDRKLWRAMRSDPEHGALMAKDNRRTFAEQYLPHVDRYPGIAEVVRYSSRYVTPIDFVNFDIHIEHSPMDTGKGCVIVELILSGLYESVVIYVNRCVLCRSFTSRLNGEIRKAMGRYDETKMFRDYRRPEEVWDPAEPRPDLPLNGDAASPGKTTDVDLDQFPFVVMQMESGYKLKGTPALMIADECESDLAQFSSSTMKKMRECSECFLMSAQLARKVLYADAFISDKTLSFVSSSNKDDKRVIYRDNLWRPEGRKAYEIQGNNSAALKCATQEAILAKVRLGEKVVLFTSNNQFGMEVDAKLRSVFPDKVVFLYNKFTDDAVKDDHFDNVDAIWRTADVVIYSPVLLAGVSFNVHDYFSTLFVYAFSSSCVVRDMMQAAGRVRKFKDSVMYYALDTYGARSYNLPITYEAVKASVLAVGDLRLKYLGDDKEMAPGDYIDPLGDVLATIDMVNLHDARNAQAVMEKLLRLQFVRKMRAAPEWLMDIHVRNIWEQCLTHNPNSFRVVFDDFMVLAGWEKAGVLTKQDVQNWENLARRQIGLPPKRVRTANADRAATRDYDSIPVIEKVAADEIETRRNRGTASNVEKMQLERFWYDNVIVGNPDAPPETLAKVFNALDDHTVHRHLMNIWAEVRVSPLAAAGSNAEINPYPEMMDNMPAVIAGIRKLCGLLGLSSTRDTSTEVSDALLQEKLQPLQEVVADLQVLSSVTPSSSTAADPVKVLKLNIDAVLNAFCGKKLKGKAARSRNNGKFVRIYTYHLQHQSAVTADIVSVVAYIR